MSRQLATAVVATLALVGCADSPLGTRYRAERALWHADREYAGLNEHAPTVEVSHWRELADRYETIARDALGSDVLVADPTDPIARDIREIAAQALFRSARVHGSQRDSLQVDRIFSEMAGTFDDLPDVAGEVTLARARIAANRGNHAEAIEHYQWILDRIAPSPGDPGAPGLVLEIPLRLARMTQQSDPQADPEIAYSKARASYDAFEAASTSPRLLAELELYRAWIEFDTGAIGAAALRLQALEKRVRGELKTELDPALVRHHAVRIQLLAASNEPERRAAVESMSRDYPQSTLSDQVLLDWAERCFTADRIDEADAAASTVIERSVDLDLRASAMLLRGRVLERHDEWNEALKTYRTLQIELPITRAALQAYLAIADHWTRAGDSEATGLALARAERELRDFITRFPAGRQTSAAYETLVATLRRAGREEDVLEALIDFSEHVAGSAREPLLLMEAARLAEQGLGDRPRAQQLYEWIAGRFPQTLIGARALEESARLRAADSAAPANTGRRD